MVSFELAESDKKMVVPSFPNNFTEIRLPVALFPSLKVKPEILKYFWFFHIAIELFFPYVNEKTGTKKSSTVINNG